jgi:SAM-dependent methyltransferase
VKLLITGASGYIGQRLAETTRARGHVVTVLGRGHLPPRRDLLLHKINMFWEWRKTRNAGWLERGVYSQLAIRQGADVLDLCCGDGFYAYYFYSGKAGTVLAVDMDAAAIRYARRHFRAPNLSYEIADIRRQMPEGVFDNIICDAALEYFAEDEIRELIRAMRDRLAAKAGTLSGHALVGTADAVQNRQYRFTSKNDLERFLTPHFKNVTVFETIFPERHNLYFWASDGKVPLLANSASAR